VRAYLEQLADIAGAEHPVHVGELVRLRGREVGREDTPRRAPPPQQLARRARRRRARPSSCSRHRHLVPHRQEPPDLCLGVGVEWRRDGYWAAVVANVGKDGAGWLAGVLPPSEEAPF
jgi:hypothetical protein